MKNWVNDITSKLIFNHKKVGLLLVTLLFVLSLFIPTYKSNALTLTDGTRYTFTVSDGIAITYTISGTYQNGEFTEIEKDNQVYIAGELIEDISKHYGSNYNMWDVLGEAYVKNEEDECKIKDIVKELFAKLVQKSKLENPYMYGTAIVDGPDLVTSYYDTATFSMKTEVKSYKNAKYNWYFFKVKDNGELEYVSRYVPFASTNYTSSWDIFMYDNGSSPRPSERFKVVSYKSGLAKAGTDGIEEYEEYGDSDKILSEFTDSEIMNFLASIVGESSYVTAFVSTGDNGEYDSGIEAFGTSYKMAFEIGDLKIDIVIKDTSNNEVARFYFADIVGTNQYKERKYTSQDTSYVNIRHNDGNYSIISGEKKADQTKTLYYRISGGDHLNIDEYNSMLKNVGINEKTLAKTIFVVMPDQTGEKVQLYIANKAKSKEAKLTLEASLPLSSLNEKYSSIGTSITCGEWLFEQYSDTELVAYKLGETDIASRGIYYDLGSMKRMYLYSDYYADLFIPVKVGRDSEYNYAYPMYKDRYFCLVKKSTKFEKKGKDFTFSDIKNDMLFSLNDPTDKLFGVTVTLKNDDAEGAGSGNKHKLKLNQTYYDTNEPDGKDYPPDIPLNDVIRSIDEFEERLNSPKASIIANINANFDGQHGIIANEFLTNIVKYGKAILLFAVILALIYASIVSIMAGANAEKRVEVKLRIKNIVIGCVIFAACVPIFTLVYNFTKDSLGTLGEISKNYSGPTYFGTQTRFTSGFFVSMIGLVIQGITNLFKWLINEVLAGAQTPGATVNMMQLIYQVTNSEGKVSSFRPFTSTEWTIYMEGYKLLSILSISLLAIAGIKTSVEFLINAGNYEKITEAKENAKRTFFAIMGIVLAPYAFRLTLYIFNALTGMLPVDGDGAEFTIQFTGSGFVGTVANFSFQVVRLRIFIAFLVRKVMIVVMLLASPIVLGMWAIDKKFRGLSLWIGESFANIAMQFSYAMVFFVVLLVSYEGQNPFVSLLMVSLVPKLASFFSKSFQGFAQRWGSVGAENTADEVVGFMKKGVDNTKNSFKKLGANLQKGAKFFDKEGITKAGRNVNNIGALLSGNPFSIRTNREMMKNRERAAKKDFAYENSALKDRKEEMKPWLDDDEVNDYKEELEREERNGNLNMEADSPSPNVQLKTGSGYDQVNSYMRQKQKTNLAKQKAAGYTNLTDRYADEGQGLFGKAGGNAIQKNLVRNPKKAQVLRNLGMGPVSALQSSAAGKLKTRAKEIEAAVAKAGFKPENIDVVGIVRDVGKMSEAMRMQKFDSLPQNFAENTMRKIESLGASSFASSVSGSKTVEYMMSVTFNFKIEKDGRVDSSMIDSISLQHDKTNSLILDNINGTDNTVKTTGHKKEDPKEEKEEKEEKDISQKPSDEEIDELVEESIKEKERDYIAKEKAVQEAKEELARAKQELEQAEASGKGKDKAMKKIKNAEEAISSAESSKKDIFDKLKDLDPGEYGSQKDFDAKIASEISSGTRKFEGGVQENVGDHGKAGKIAEQNIAQQRKKNTPH